MTISTLTQKELIYHVDMGVKAVLTVPTLEAALKEQGITPDKAKKGLELIKEANLWQGRQDDTLENAQKAQRTLKHVRDSIEAIYRRHRIAARFVYREDEVMFKKLQLKGKRKMRYTDWLDQIQKFYTHLDAEAVVQFGILPKEVSEVKKLLGQLSELNVLRNDARRQTHQATEAKQKALADLRQWFSRFMRVAELACQDDPQLLEAMGITVAAR
ncbi:hypothetical protein [Catalinimonas niigatensis]|uniref:hypothetical protein n=1 Tax=Catalinimonas niigatensis TaxID=1397264 RepID=UPI0026662075|nr:hypothetical protein [Catalinimonas niigatensis]WPP51443.1 hypothetical protein PZB72_03455 [Catalinimonas niigatensis]